MDKALCTENGLIYSAVEFSRLQSFDLERMRRLLLCPECRGTAFFQKASFNGHRIACFGAFPHTLGCPMAVFDYVRPGYSDADDQDDLCIPNSKIIVDFGYGSPNYFDVSGYTHSPDRYDRNLLNNSRSDTPISRRLRPLLKLLIESPEFGNSNLPIEVHGSEFSTRELFVPLLDVTSQYLGKFRGFWGLLSDVRLSDDKRSVWFNSGGRSTISFRLDVTHLTEFNQRYRIHDEEDLAGAYILVFGTLSYSPAKQLYCEIEDLNLMTLKFS